MTDGGKRERVRGMFTAIAPRYDFLNHLLSLNLDRRWRRVAVGRLGWERAPGGRYLDLCAGTLDLAAELGNVRGFTGRVIGADFVHAMLVRGQGKSGRVVPLVADALALPFADASFDGAMVGFGVRNLADLDDGLAEAARVLKDGARLVILEFTTPPRQPFRALYFAYFRRILPAVGRLVSKHRTAYTYLPESVLAFPDPEALAERLRRAGFREVGWRSMTAGVCAVYEAVKDGKTERRTGATTGGGQRETHETRMNPHPTDSLPREGQVLSGESLAARYANFVKLPHTLFALPFALLGLIAASIRTPVTWRTVGLVVLAFTAARWVAMGFNRIADREFDALNPRTRNRELPQGRLTLRQAWISVLVAGGVFVGSAIALNPLCGWLSPLALIWIMAYSLSKRFTWWPHLWLGMSLAIAPVGGYLAVSGGWSEPWWMLAAVTIGVATWVAGFDIFYALPDRAFDQSVGVRSVVVRLGIPRSITVAKFLHGVTIPALVLFGFAAGFGLWYYLGLIAATLILAYEHQLVRPDDLSRLNAAFFSLNAIMSMTVFAFALADRLL